MYFVLSFHGKKEGVNTDIADHPKQSGNLAWGEKIQQVCCYWGMSMGERERLRSVLQQIQQKTKDSLCIRSCIYSWSHNAVTLAPPEELLWHRGLSYLVWNMERGILWDTGGKGTTQSHHVHSALVLGSQLPSFYWESSHAGPLAGMVSILGVSEVQIPMPPSSRAMSYPWGEDVAGLEGV